MTIYIAFLRGINVGGKNKIKMADLKRTLESVGLFEVKTYIQSGNVLFKSNETEESLCDRIEREIETVFGIRAEVILRTSTELEQIIFNCPFSKEDIREAEALSEVESLYVALLKHQPAKEKIECIDAYRSEGDRCHITGRDVYLLFQHSIRNSKLAKNLYKLNVSATVRNWKTLSKLVALAKSTS
ncbi:DUF1697 domain-containing protein [Parasporobacterium paucivorans]|uniref:Uncharacterized conserved protein, DUF1697 family n=1 Tax=Parasporobacterium paucivorans DSM 15970 TaxID=1122934 RepID=A0A1M6L2P1_9FIRM|nr:DUF1697 domain-containing protein [Parasporobacterium paucivorans]SHJ65515.1 Uncharacterized conserved protein, DUF1697 family [Parasporobacterium paucivorans DSM 15970]